VSATRIVFCGLNLGEPQINTWFGGMYRSFFAALARHGCDVRYSPAGAPQQGDFLVVPVGGGQDRMAARAMARFDGRVILYVPSAQAWFRSSFLDRWRHKILWVYGTDTAEETSRLYRDIGLAYHGMPFASDPRVMRPLGVGEAFDVVFVGNAQSGVGRHAYVEALLAELGRDRVLVVGPGWQGLGYPSQSVAWGPLLNAIYNLGRVCVNVHNLEQWSTPCLRLDANNRLFDLAMAGRPQVCVASNTAAQFFTEDEVAGADTPEEFVTEVVRLLLDTTARRAMAANARERATLHHSWDARAADFANWLPRSKPESRAHTQGWASSLWRLRDTELPSLGPWEVTGKLARRATRLGGSHSGGGF